MLDNKFIKISYEVSEAIKNGKPVVALESTIITHGMPYPANYETALAVENVIRDNGAIPATIAVIDGIIRVGLTEDEIKETAQSKSKFIKCTTRDLPFAVTRKLSGSTTVAATMVCAHRAGIKVFVTGGIGGVHYGDNWDVSADLLELSRTPVIVVSAGIKSILDINKTLEVLESYSVPVIGYKTDKFPEFFFSEGDFDVHVRMDTHEEIAEMFNNSLQLQLNSGMLVAVPVPKEHEADKQTVKESIIKALKKADEQNIRGGNITPFLLREVCELSNGNSLESNIALIKNNAEQGAKISVELTNKLK